MKEILSYDDVVDVLEASQQGENCLCSSIWLNNLANKIKNTLNELQQIKIDTECVGVATKPNQNEQKSSKTVRWSGQLMYKHRGFSLPRFEDLSLYETESKEEAFQLANSCAREWMETTFKENEIEYWDVKIKPVVS